MKFVYPLLLNDYFTVFTILFSENGDSLLQVNYLKIDYYSKVKWPALQANNFENWYYPMPEEGFSFYEGGGGGQCPLVFIKGGKKIKG